MGKFLEIVHIIYHYCYIRGPRFGALAYRIVYLLRKCSSGPGCSKAD